MESDAINETAKTEAVFRRLLSELLQKAQTHVNEPAQPDASDLVKDLKAELQQVKEELQQAQANLAQAVEDKARAEELQRSQHKEAQTVLKKYDEQITTERTQSSEVIADLRTRLTIQDAGEPHFDISQTPIPTEAALRGRTFCFALSRDRSLFLLFRVSCKARRSEREPDCCDGNGASPQ